MSPAPRRRYSWNRSRSESFGPIRQVGVAASIGLPLMGIGALMLVAALSGAATWMWWGAGVLLVVGLITAASGRIL